MRLRAGSGMLVVKTRMMSLPCHPVVALVPSLMSLPGRIQCASPDWSMCASVHPSCLNSSGHVVAAQYLDAGPSSVSMFAVDSYVIGMSSVCFSVSISTIHNGMSAGLCSAIDLPSTHS
jgi:hypothetical protein